MKCIHCQRDSKKSERVGGLCPGCNRPFAFDPTQGQPTDPGFQAAIDRVSAKGTVRFSAENLYFELARSKFGRSQNTGCGMVLVFIGSGVLSVLLGPKVLIGGMVIFFVLVVVHVYGEPPKSMVQLSPSDAQQWLRRWQATHGLPAGLIEPRALLPTPESLDAMRAELEQYSFDRAVICDRRETVDLLLANNFHFENNCAVLSIDGYPQSVFDIVLRMLKNNPKLHIFALHDATMAGCALAYKLAHDRAWFAGQGPIFDVGLRPAHAQASAFKGLWQAAPASARNDPRPLGMSDEEYAWLRRYQLSLAAVRPEQVIKRLFRAINERKADSTALVSGERKADSTALVVTDGAPVSHVDTIIFSSDATTSDGGGDSFG